MAARRGLGVLLASLALASGCADPDTVATSRDAIIGGTPTAGDPAAVLIVTYPADLSSFSTCTATCIAPDLLLTAAHCVDPQTHPDGGMGVFEGADASAYPTASTLIPQLAEVSEVHLHPDYDRDAPFFADIAVLRLAQALAAPPLPVLGAPLDASMIPLPARIVGYGETTYGELNLVKHEAGTVIAELGPVDTMRVGDAEHRSCIGDSGGPALVELGGVEMVAGVDSYAELAGCLEPAEFRRTDAHKAFLETFVTLAAPPDTSSGGAGAGGEAPLGYDPAEPNEGGCAVTPRRASPLWLTVAIALALGIGLRARRRTSRPSSSSARV